MRISPKLHNLQGRVTHDASAMLAMILLFLTLAKTDDSVSLPSSFDRLVIT